MNRIKNIPTVRFRNALLLLGFNIICLCLIISYITEYFNGNRTLGYVVQYSIVLLTMLAIYIITYRSMCDTSTKYAYLVMIIYSIFCVYTMISSPYCITFCYVYPMLLLYAMYDNPRLSYVAALCNIFGIVIAAIHHLALDGYLPKTEYKIAIACSVLVLVFMQMNHLPALRDLRRLESLESDIQIDTLTKCWNRRYLDNLIEHNYFARTSASIILGDINDFKHINDTLGHVQGDVVLSQVGEKLRNVCSMFENTEPIRIGGDEFIIVTDKPVDTILRELNKFCIIPVTLGKQDVDIELAFGFCSNVTGKLNYAQMYEFADSSMYNVKQNMKSYMNTEGD